MVNRSVVRSRLEQIETHLGKLSILTKKIVYSILTEGLRDIPAILSPIIQRFAWKRLFHNLRADASGGKDLQ